VINDWLGTRLAGMIGLPVPPVAVVNVNPWLLEQVPELRIDIRGSGSGTGACRKG
jgi:hypothetical protein